ncbi:hypothetical protein DL98DRAFT_661243 [Cadophora sp. DSE1049]|nr:hypothetical protein DL98DRAFT_661243 [Cadophora sp. DSE1049]
MSARENQRHMPSPDTTTQAPAHLSAMSSSDDTDCSDLVQTALSGDKVRVLTESLLPYFTLESLPVGIGWSKVECLYDESKALAAVREAYMDEFVRSEKITDTVQAIITRPGKTCYLARKVQLLVFQKGQSIFDRLVGKDDCIVLIPVAISGSPMAIVQEPKGTEESKGGRKTTLTFKTNSELMISGRCSIVIPDQTKVVCVMLCIGMDKG